MLNYRLFKFCLQTKKIIFVGKIYPLRGFKIKKEEIRGFSPEFAVNTSSNDAEEA